MSKPSFSVDRRALLVMGASTVLLSACSDLIGPTDAAVPLYVLKAATVPAGGGPRVRWQLSVVLPEAPDSLDSDRIALVQPNALMDYYANAAWQDRLTFLVQGSLIDAFENTGRIAAVGRDTEGLKSDYLLLTDIRDFQARYDAPDGIPTALVRISAKLISAHTRNIATSISAHSEIAAAQNTVPSVVQAFGQALTATLSQITDWALSAPTPERA